MVDRIRITQPLDIHQGKIAYILERVDQHSLYTYIVRFAGSKEKRAYQRFDFNFLKPVKKMPS